MTLATDCLQIISGPIVRKFTHSQLVLWYVTDQKATPAPVVYQCDNAKPVTTSHQLICHQVGSRAFIQHLIIDIEQPLRCGQSVEYDIGFQTDSRHCLLTELLPDLCYEGLSRPRVYYQNQLTKVLHGSCRKPHHIEPDALVRVDQHLNDAFKKNQEPAALLMMSGDQVYVDDVAGPFLQAITQTINHLGLFDEQIPGATVDNYADLIKHPNCYYKRTELLPLGEKDQEVQETFFKSKRKPIFTSVNAKNHLITLSEVLAMYFLVWSPALWSNIEFSHDNIPEDELETFDEEKQIILEFVTSLTAIRRAFAHIPVYMIFDDHDITDDWNLTREWEELAYGHPFSKRIIGNALFGYWLCQGIGNAPEKFQTLLADTQACFTPNGIEEQHQIIEKLLHWNYWHYDIDTLPKMIVLDTRTHRWRSEKNANKPSGLLDWERLKELKYKVTGEKSVIIVSAAPMFGVKIIEAIQKIFTWFGQALTVDAENWMAHQGTAKVLLNILKDKETAEQYIILSGDVHYSFTYDIRLRFRSSSPSIYQLTASGFKNQFPIKLISMLDTFNRHLYGHRSPLNWFTKRRRMNIMTRYPDRKNKRTSLVSKSGVGLLELTDERRRPVAKVLLHDGSDIEFK